MVYVDECEKYKQDIVKSNTNYWLFSKYINTINPYNKFSSWECGLSSSERRNIARVKKVLNALDSLNRNNLKEGSEFFDSINMSIKVFMESAGYDIKTTDTSYSIKRIKERVV